MPAHQGQGIHQHLDALGVPFGSSHQPVQLPPPHRMQAFVPVHCAAFPDHVPVRGQPSRVHRIGPEGMRERSGTAPPPAAARTAAKREPRCDPPPRSPPTGCRRPPPPPPSRSSALPASPHAAPHDRSTSQGPHLITGHHYRRLAPRQPLRPTLTMFPQTAQGFPPPFFTQPSTAGPLYPNNRPMALRLTPSRYIATPCSFTAALGRR